MSDKSDILEDVLPGEEPKRDTEDNVGNYQGDFQREGIRLSNNLFYFSSKFPATLGG